MSRMNRSSTTEYRSFLSRAGYTLVELIVVLTILAITAGTGIFAMIGWIDKVHFDKVNNQARILYVAAQNQLTEYDANGRLPVFRENFTATGGGAHVLATAKDWEEQFTALAEDDAVGPLNQVWKEARKAWQSGGPASAEEADYRGSIVSVILTKEDFAAYQAGDSSLSVQKQAIYQLFEDYITDAAVLDAAICVEFSPEAGLILSVLYSDEAEGFTYDTNNNTKGIISIVSREKKERKKRMVGYYGAKQLSKATEDNKEKERPVLDDLHLVNDDTLYLQYKLKKLAAATGQLDYDIAVYDSETDKPKMQITLPGSQLKNAPSAIPAKVAYSFNESGIALAEGSADAVYIKYNVIAWMDTDQAVHVILDAADMDATSNSYYKDSPTLRKAVKGQTSSSLDVYATDMATTASFHRFGIDTEDIYCTVQGHAVWYQPTAKKRSNTENTYFASCQADKQHLSGGRTADKLTYKIENARHLYNMRYLEDCSETELASYYGYSGTTPVSSITYRVTKDFNWKDFQDFYKSGTSTTGLKMSGEQADFPSVRQLRAEDVFEGETALFSNEPVTITGLSLSSEANKGQKKITVSSTEYDASTSIYDPANKEQKEYADNSSVGLFMRNYGTIESLAFDQISVKGGKNVGAICAIDSGKGFKDLVIGHTNDAADAQKASTIAGLENVGGIAGNYQATNDDIIVYDHLINYAAIEELPQTGIYKATQNFGGIIGSADYANSKGNTIKNGTLLIGSQTDEDKGCANYGRLKVLSHRDDDRQKETENIGGIAGLCDSTNYNIIVANCKAAPQYSRAELGADYENVEDLLNGWYVGGIIGYNNGAAVEYCSTTKEDDSSEGYILGDHYVGGIVGFNAAEEATLSGLNKNKSTVNEAHVIGSDFVGGIVGYNPTGTITGWNNTGYVGASGSFAGGIAGANGAVTEAVDQDNKELYKQKGLGNSKNKSDAGITRCISQMTNDTIAKKLENLPLFGKADYVGGMAGYNDGTITYDPDGRQEAALTVHVRGADYVGGVVGYNDTYAEISGYTVEGGNVFGSVFVGGMAGCNLSSELLMDGTAKQAHVLKSNPDQVEGSFCVGGTIGGNILVADEDINTVFRFSDFTGQVGTADTRAFAGGFIGYNSMIRMKGNNNNDKILVKRTARSAITDCVKGFNDALTQNAPAKTYVSLLPDFGNSGNIIYNDAVKLTISGEGNAGNGTNQAGSVRAGIYVGGVLGFGDEHSELQIKDVINMLSVRADDSVTDDTGFEQKVTVAGRTTARTDDFGNYFRYSYAGGIIGKLAESAAIEGCRNAQQASVTAKGTYTGGLVEINEGRLLSCEVQEIGSDNTNYVGGLAGLNEGEISDSIFKAYTVSGNDYVGGIAAENAGTIENTDIDGGTVEGKGAYVGGITGYNHAGASIENASSKTILATVSGKTYVGGAAGGSEGRISGKTGQIFTIKADSKVKASNKYAGGAAGIYKGTAALERLHNQADVTAVSGYAGGIAGAVEKNTVEGSIINCINTGDITTTRTGHAGGIAAVNEGIINDCGSNGAVSSTDGSGGGIAAINKGTISKCQVTIPVDTNEASLYKQFGLSYQKAELVIEATEAAGGIAGVNHGNVRDCACLNLTVSNTPESESGSNVGGVVGTNRPDGNKVPVMSGNSMTACLIRGMVSESNVGGLAGFNEAEITGSNTVTDADLTLEAGIYANAGGAAGKNLGKINGVNIEIDITGQLGSADYGYGGIAGYNSGSITGCTYNAKAENTAKVDSAKSITGTFHGIRANGAADNKANTGGIAGLNADSGVVSDCRIAASHASAVFGGTSDKNSGNTGGMIGWNKGSITGCDNDAAGGKAVTIVGFAGPLGGIVGENDTNAVVAGTADKYITTGDNWTVTACAFSEGSGVGGIIGHSSSEKNISYLKNYAPVEHKAYQGVAPALGGMTGLYENRTGSASTISYCYNYAPVNGHDTGISGGMIGQNRFKCANMNRCYNYGDISGAKAGGILGEYADTEVSRNIEICGNFGDLTGTNAGGMIGGGADRTVTLTLCVNVGCIKTSGTGGGMTGYDSSNASFYRCRNYGNGTISSGAEFYGISKNYKTMNQCLNLSNQVLKMAGVNNTGGSILNYSYGPNDERTGFTPGNVLPLHREYSLFNYWLSVPGLGVTGDITLGGFKTNPKSAVTDMTHYSRLLDGETHSPGSHPDTSLLDKSMEEGSRQKVYEEVDPAYLSKIGAAISGTSSWIDITQQGGTLRFTWSTALAYDTQEIQYRLPTDTAFTTLQTLSYGIDSYDYTYPESWSGRRITFRIVNYNTDKTRSSYQDRDVYIYEALPVPKVHLELADERGYVAVLDNYEEFDQKAYRENGSIMVTIQASLEGKNLPYTIDLRKGNIISDQIYPYTDVNEDICLKAGAVWEGKDSNYNPSGEYRTRTRLHGSNLLIADQGTGLCSSLFLGFTGKHVKDMSYNLELTGQNGADHCVNAELAAGGLFRGSTEHRTYDLNLIVAQEECHVVNSSTKSITLTDIPAKLWKQYPPELTVRSYLWRSQGDAVWFGHPVAENQTEEQILAYIDAAGTKDGLFDQRYGLPKAEVFAAVGNRVSLSEGYQLRRNPDGTYDIFYSALLADDRGVYDHKDLSEEITGARQKQPVISVNTEEEAVTDQLVIRWDEETGDNYSETAKYSYSIYGCCNEAGEDKTVLIDEGTYYTDGNASAADKHDSDDRKNELIYSTEEWNLRSLEILVTREGEADKQGRTIAYPATATLEVPLKQRLSQISMPVLTMEGKNGLYYYASWTGVPYEEEAFVKNYEITIREIKANGQEIGKEYTISVDADKRQQLLNLSEFNNCTVGVSVRALAVENDDYRDGISGAEGTLTLTKRLEAPDVNLLSGSPSWEAHSEQEPADQDTFLSSSDYLENGITLRYQENMDETDYDAQAGYELAISICDSADDNTGTVLTQLYTKEQPAVMEGDMRDSSFTVKGLTEEYAGKWLRIAMRTTAGSDGSSAWSDDPYSPGTQVRWIRIPRLRLSVPHVTEQYISENQIFDAGNGKKQSVTVQKKALTFGTVERADGYLIEMIHKTTVPEDISESAFREQYASYLYLRKVEPQKYEVYFTTTDPGDTTRKKNKQLIIHDDIPALYYIGMSSAQELSLPCCSILQASGCEIRQHLTVSMPDAGTVKLILPDIYDNNAGSAYSAVNFTDQITVQALSVGAGLDSFENSQIALWYEGMSSGAELIMDDYSEAQSFSYGKLKRSAREGFAYEFSGTTQNNHMIYEVTAPNGSKHYISSLGRKQAGSGVETVAFLPKQYFDDLRTGDTLTVRGAQLGSGGRRGISRWSDPVTLTVQEDTLDITSMTDGQQTDTAAEMIGSSAAVRIAGQTVINNITKDTTFSVPSKTDASVTMTGSLHVKETAQKGICEFTLCLPEDQVEVNNTWGKCVVEFDENVELFVDAASVPSLSGDNPDAAESAKKGYAISKDIKNEPVSETPGENHLITGPGNREHKEQKSTEETPKEGVDGHDERTETE